MWHPHDMATGFPLEQVLEESKVAAAVSFMTCPQKSHGALHTLQFAQGSPQCGIQYT